MSTKKKSSKNAITAGVLITLYLVTYVVIGAISMPIPILFLLMPMLVALFAAPTYHMLHCFARAVRAALPEWGGDTPRPAEPRPESLCWERAR